MCFSTLGIFSATRQNKSETTVNIVSSPPNKPSVYNILPPSVCEVSVCQRPQETQRRRLCTYFACIQWKYVYLYHSFDLFNWVNLKIMMVLLKHSSLLHPSSFLILSGSLFEAERQSYCSDFPLVGGMTNGNRCRTGQRRGRRNFNYILKKPC